MSVVSEQRQRSIGEKEGAREGGANKGAITKKGELLSKDCERRTNTAHQVNSSGNCFEELFSFLKREKKKEESRHLYFHAMVSLN